MSSSYEICESLIGRLSGLDDMSKRFDYLKRPQVELRMYYAMR